MAVLPIPSCGKPPILGSMYPKNNARAISLSPCPLMCYLYDSFFIPRYQYDVALSSAEARSESCQVEQPLFNEGSKKESWSSPCIYLVFSGGWKPEGANTAFGRTPPLQIRPCL